MIPLGSIVKGLTHPSETVSGAPGGSEKREGGTTAHQVSGHPWKCVPEKKKAPGLTYSFTPKHDPGLGMMFG